MKYIIERITTENFDTHYDILIFVFLVILLLIYIL